MTADGPGRDEVQESARRLRRTGNRAVLAVAGWYVPSWAVYTTAAALHWPHAVYVACVASDVVAIAAALAVQWRASRRHNRVCAARRARWQAEREAFIEEEKRR